MKFCSDCGSAVSLQIPEGDDRQRHVCDGCGAIHYLNPRVIVGCLVTSGDKVLLCRRAIEPQINLWTLPGGFMENGETLAEGAARETFEEAAAKAVNLQLYRMFDVAHIDQVYVMFRGELEGGFAPGIESFEVKLFDEKDIPWDQIAFPVMTDTLVEYFEDRKSGVFPVRLAAPTRRWVEHGNIPPSRKRREAEA